MKRFLVVLALVAGSLWWAGTAGATNGRVLILDSTVSGGAGSREAQAAVAAGKGVDVINGAQWAAMSTAQFAAYDAIVLGDPTCQTGQTAIAPAIANAGTWEPAVTGNVIVIGTDPVYHASSRVGAQRLIQNGVAFAANDAPRTGLYLDLSCYYAFSTTNTPIPWMSGLSSFGSFSLRGQFAFGTGCPARSHIVATAPVLSGLTDADLSNWSCSTHESFDSFPADFDVLVINEDIAQTYTASDGTQGGPYILVRGREVHVISDITLTPASATNQLGSPHTLTATVSENGSPVVGATVTFTVVGGPNAGVVGTGVTDLQGHATFTYTSAVAGTDLIRASFVDSSGHTQTSDAVSKTWIAVTEQPITATGNFTLTGVEASPVSGTVATFTDPDQAATAGDYAATIDWGDGSPTSTGTIAGSSGSFTVDGSHTYADHGSYTITVTITDVDTPSNTQTVTSSATIDDALITATGGYTFTGVEPATVAGTVASFSDPNPAEAATNYAATIDWGDGSPTSTGTIAGSGGAFTVDGSHTYADEGVYTITVTITDVDTASNSQTVTSSATIADAPLSAAGTAAPVSGQSYSGNVASFTDGNPTSTTADFTATIDWGDGSPTSAGTVAGGGGSFTVSGSHTYSGTGNFTITVHIVDDGGSTADATSQVLIFGSVTGGGMFVIGDKNAALGTSVTFWGAQWWKLNGLSGGAAPAAFKGFANSPAAIGCGTTWTTSPGNSPPPPAGPLPAYMGVVVSGSIGQSGSTISGKAVHIVVVKTNAGYANDPGHAGTGTVVANVC